MREAQHDILFDATGRIVHDPADAVRVERVVYDAATHELLRREWFTRITPIEAAAEWDESEHPRDDAGKFAEKGGGGAKTASPLAWLQKGIRSAIEERPERRGHGYTGHNAFFVTPDGTIVPWHDAPRPGTAGKPMQGWASVHSHGSDSTYLHGAAPDTEDIDPMNSADIDIFRRQYRDAGLDTDVVIDSAGRMYVLRITPDTRPEFFQLKKKQLEDLLHGGHGETAYKLREKFYLETGGTDAEFYRQRLRDFADTFGLEYRDDLRWDMGKPLPALAPGVTVNWHRGRKPPTYDVKAQNAESTPQSEEVTDRADYSVRDDEPTARCQTPDGTPVACLGNDPTVTLRSGGDFDEAKHPRDEHGRWVEVEGDTVELHPRPEQLKPGQRLAHPVRANVVMVKGKKYVVVYHGTETERAKSIIKVGLIAAPEALDKSFLRTFHLSDTGKVYVSTREDGAEHWAESAQELHTHADEARTQPVVLKFLVPIEELPKFDIDEHFVGWTEQALEHPGPLKKEWLVAVRRQKPNGDWTEWAKPGRLAAAASAGIVLYVGALQVGDAMRAAAEWDEEKHPRDEHGRWTEAGGAEPDPAIYRKKQSDYAPLPAKFDPLLTKDYDAYSDYRRTVQRPAEARWEREVSAALSLGKLTPEEATALGYHDPSPSDPHTGIGKWEPLPDTLYHVTTARDAVLADGLKSREELGQDMGAGLGGGDRTSISFTTDRAIAQDIADGVRTMIAVAQNTITLNDILDAATEGTGAKRPWMEDMIRSGTYFIAGGHPRDWEMLRKGLVRANDADLRAVLPEAVWKKSIVYDPAALPKGWVPIGDGVKGSDGVTRYSNFYRPIANEDEAAEKRIQVLKTWLFWREHAGGRSDPLFFLNDYQALRRMDPKQVAILEAHPVTGARGYQERAMGEWRTHTGRAVRVRLADFQAAATR